MQLPVGNSQRRTGDQDAFGALGNDGDTVLDALLQLIGQAVAHLGAADGIVEERDLSHQQDIASGDGQALALAAVIDALHGFALLVVDADGLSELFHGDGVAGEFFHLLGKLCDLLFPFQDVLLALHLGNVHDIHGHVFAQNLIGLLLAVAGGLSDVHIRDAEERTCSAETGADAGLDQGAGALREHSLAAGDPELGAATEAGDNAVGRHDDLVGDIDTESTEDFSAFFLLGLDQLGGADSVNLRNDQIPEVHGLGSVFLREKYVTDGGRQHLAEQIVVLQIHAELFPHFYIIGHSNLLLLSV